jgi:hypothetical protein
MGTAFEKSVRYWAAIPVIVGALGGAAILCPGLGEQRRQLLQCELQNPSADRPGELLLRIQTCMSGAGYVWIEESNADCDLLEALNGAPSAYCFEPKSFPSRLKYHVELIGMEVR